MQATPLHLASANGHCTAISVLLENGADVAALDGVGRPALMHAAAANRHDVMLLLLLQSDCVNLSATDMTYGRTSLHWACHCGNLDAVNLLLVASMADLDATDTRQDTALHLAARRGHAAVVELLLSRGAQSELRNVRQLTPLHLAAFFGHAAAVEVLLSSGANPAARCADNRTPLFWAAYNGQTEAAQLLRKAGGANGLLDDDVADLATDDGLDVSQSLLVGSSSYPDS